MRRLHPNGIPEDRPASWSALPPDDPAAHEQMIKFISESIVDDLQGNISSGFMRQIHASKKSAMSPHDKAERMRIVRDMRSSLERLTEELGQKFFEEFRERPGVGRWYDSWLFNETPQFLRWEQEWAFAPEESVLTVGARSIAGSIDGRVFGSETTPEVRVESEGDLEEFEDTQELTQIPEYRPNAPVTEVRRKSPILRPNYKSVDVDVVRKKPMARRTRPLAASANIRTKVPTSANRAPAAIKVTAALHLVVVTRPAGTTSTASRSTTSSASTSPGPQRSLTRVSSRTCKNTISKRLSRLIFSSTIFCPVSTMYQMETMRQLMRGAWNGRLPTTGRTRRQTPKSFNVNFSVSGLALATSAGSGSSHSATIIASGSEAGNKAARYGTAQTAGVVASSRNGIAENATNALMGERSHVVDVEESRTLTTKNTRGDRIQAVLVKAVVACQRFKKTTGKKLKTRLSKDHLRNL